MSLLVLPIPLRSRAAWTYLVVVIGALWLTTWKWRNPSAPASGLTASTFVNLRTAADDRGLAAWFPPLHESVDSRGFKRVSAHNALSLRSLLQCMQIGTCEQNQDKVVILEDIYLVNVERGTDWIGGEMIWANSTVKALGTLGYTYLFATRWEHALSYHNLFPDLVVAVVMNPETLVACWEEKFDCAKSPHNPNGLPIWKLLAFYFWGNNVSPLDARWVLSPEPWPAFDAAYPNAYVGYSIEERCSQHLFVPFDARERRAYILGKHLHYFVPNDYDGDPAWEPEVWEHAVKELGVSFVASIKNELMPDGREVPVGLPIGIQRLPQLGPDEFVDELAKSRVLIGIGNPRTSPTPYEALCMGVPFINPIMSWDENDPENKSRWSCQHDALCFYGPGPPYVYNIKRGDRRGLFAAITAASSNPIERYILDMTRQSAVVKRLDAILQQDRLEMAKELLRQRKDGSQKGELFEI